MKRRAAAHSASKGAGAAAEVSSAQRKAKSEARPKGKALKRSKS